MLVELSGDLANLSINGVVLAKNLRLERRLDACGVGLAVYGKARCYVKRFRVLRREEEAISARKASAP